MSDKRGAPAPAAIERIGSYRLKKTLGIGSFGKVKLAEHIETGLHVAIKILNMNRVLSSEMKDKMMREISILRMFSHPHVIHLYEIITTPSEIYLVMEYCPNGELFDFIVSSGKLPEDEARKVFQQIVAGIEYCHLHKVSHRDLKPENILLAADNTIRIADFGLSNLMRDGMFLKTSCGSPNYAAPEVISGNLYAGPEVDAWSCGVILYALVCGSLPFDDDNVTALFRKIRGGLYTLPGHLSQGVRDLIPRLLTVDCLKRMTLPELRQNPWFRTNLDMCAVAFTHTHFVTLCDTPPSPTHIL
jgi:5'-AMP-activated protein kinase, catalytic alpha subunit